MTLITAEGVLLELGTGTRGQKTRMVVLLGRGRCLMTIHEHETMMAVATVDDVRRWQT